MADSPQEKNKRKRKCEKTKGKYPARSSWIKSTNDKIEQSVIT